MAFRGSTSGELSEFYQLSEDVHRSSLPVHELGIQGFSHLASAFEERSDCQRHEAMDPAKSHAWFQASAVAPELPQDEGVRLVCTNFCSSQRAGELGNRLLEFLDAEITCRITKVESDKCCIKFAIDAQGFQANVKVRIYSMAHGIGHMVEFQKLRGDTTVFCSIFQRAKKLLQTDEALSERSELILLPELKFANKDAIALGFLAMEGLDTEEASGSQPRCFNQDVELSSFELEPVSDDMHQERLRTQYWGPLQA